MRFFRKRRRLDPVVAAMLNDGRIPWDQVTEIPSVYEQLGSTIWDQLTDPIKGSLTDMVQHPAGSECDCRDCRRCGDNKDIGVEALWCDRLYGHTGLHLDESQGVYWRVGPGGPGDPAGESP